MHERRALIGAAWRELWPVAALAMGVALWCATSVFERLPSSPWTVLWLVPAALYAGAACGRSTSRALVFLLARPFRRERILASRLRVCGLALISAWFVAGSAVFAKDLHVVTLTHLLLALGAILVAFACALVGATVTEREPLAMGIGVLLFVASPLGCLLPVEWLDITAARVLRVHPVGFGLIATVVIGGFAWIVQRGWQHHLPYRDHAFTKRLLLGCALIWSPAQMLCLAMTWDSASASNAVPMAIVGRDGERVVIAAGSPASIDGSELPRIDTIRAGDEVLFDATSRSTWLDGRDDYEITTAFWASGRLVVGVRERHGWNPACRTLLVDLDRSVREIATQCGEMTVSANAQFLELASARSTVFFDLSRDGMPTRTIGPDERRRELGRAAGRLVTTSSDGRIYIGGDEFHIPGFHTAVLAPSARRLVVQKQGDHRRGRQRSGSIAVLDTVGSAVRFFDAPAPDFHVIGWLDDDHIAVLCTPVGERARRLDIVAISSGATVVSAPAPQSLHPRSIQGPISGPWLLDTGGRIEAWSAAGEVMWVRGVTPLERDTESTRRWLIIGDKVVGYWNARMWEQDLPWMVSP